MIYVEDLGQNHVQYGTKWWPAVPLPGPFWWRVKDAWRVLRGEAIALSRVPTRGGVYDSET